MVKILNSKDLTKEELEDKFNNFIFNIDDYLESIIDKADEQGCNLDYSLRSLNDLEKYLSENNTDKDSDDVNDAAAYFGEVVRKNFGGTWKCSLNMETNSMYYGKPVITNYTDPEDLELSPFESVLFYLIEPTENHFLGIIENDLDFDGLNLNDIPTEED